MLLEQSRVNVVEPNQSVKANPMQSLATDTDLGLYY